MLDARIILDELEIRVACELTSAMAERVAREIAKALGRELQELQRRRASEFQAGDRAPGSLSIRRASVLLEDPSTSPRTIARSIADEIKRGLRQHA